MHIVMTLLLGGLIGAMAGWLTHKHIPGGIIGNILVGVVGSFLGHVLLGPMGPAWKGFFLFPALLGALLFVLVLSLIHVIMKKYQ
ncbi:GlsB/YeaQ/YmgE family stress response membrane protein [Bacillus cereus]